MGRGGAGLSRLIHPRQGLYDVNKAVIYACVSEEPLFFTSKKTIFV